MKLFTTITELTGDVFGGPCDKAFYLEYLIDRRMYAMNPFIPTSPMEVTIPSNSC
jgi:hypothetical protein